MSLPETTLATNLMTNGQEVQATATANPYIAKVKARCHQLSQRVSLANALDAMRVSLFDRTESLGGWNRMESDNGSKSRCEFVDFRINAVRRRFSAPPKESEHVAIARAYDSQMGVN
jgi:hypothetical protein